LVLFILFFQKLNAHSLELSSLMIYEQEGKRFLVIKSSISAFQEEIDFHYKKNRYKTPEEFMQLVLKHFEKNYALIINNEKIRFINTRVILGHETTLFAELANVPKQINSLQMSNNFFKDMNNNQCELILSFNNLPQKQYIFNNENNHAVQLNVKNNLWIEEDPNNPFFKNTKFLYLTLIVSLLVIASIAFFNRNKNLVLTN
jgi:hypothetical protein